MAGSGTSAAWNGSPRGSAENKAGRGSAGSRRRARTRCTGGAWVSLIRPRGAHPARTYPLGSLPAYSPKNTKAVPAHMRPTDNGAPIWPVRFKLRLSPIRAKPASVMMFMPNKMSLVSIAPPGPTECGSCISRPASCNQYAVQNRLKIATTLQSRRQKIRHFFAVPTDPPQYHSFDRTHVRRPAVNLASEHARLAGKPHGCDAPRERRRESGARAM